MKFKACDYSILTLMAFSSYHTLQLYISVNYGIEFFHQCERIYERFASLNNQL